MKIKRGIDKRFYAVFNSEDDAEHMAWFYQGILRGKWACFNGYLNAFKLT